MLIAACGLSLATWGFVTWRNTGSLTAPAQTGALSPRQEVRYAPATFTDAFFTGDTLTLTGEGSLNSAITLFIESAPLSSVKTDKAGNWSAQLFLPARASALAVEIITKLPDGTDVKSDETLLIISMQDDKLGEITSETPHAVLIATPGGASQIIRFPFDAPPEINGLSLRAVDYDNAGGVIFSGRSESEGIIRILANNALVGQTGLAADGSWTLIPNASLPRGLYTLTVQRLNDNDKGKVSASMPLPFERRNLEKIEGESGVKIMPAFHEDNWVVSRSLYGGGVQHTLLYSPVAFIP